MEIEQYIRSELPRLLRFARRLTPTQQDAEDVIQESVMAFCKRIDYVDQVQQGELTSAKRILFNIVYRQSCMFHRRRYSDPLRTLSSSEIDLCKVVEEQDLPSPDSRLIHSELCEAVEKRLRLLSDRDRALIQMHYYEALSLEEVANRFSLSKNAVSVALHRARKRLSEQLSCASNQ